MVPQQHHSVELTQVHGAANQLAAASLTLQRLWRRVGQALVIGIPLLLLTLFVVYPLAAIILQSVFPSLYASSPSLVPSLDALRQVFADSVSYSALLSSLWLSGITALLAALLGTFLAILARRTDLPLRLYWLLSTSVQIRPQ